MHIIIMTPVLFNFLCWFVFSKMLHFIFSKTDQNVHLFNIFTVHLHIMWNEVIIFCYIWFLIHNFICSYVQAKQLCSVNFHKLNTFHGKQLLHMKSASSVWDVPLLLWEPPQEWHNSDKSHPKSLSPLSYFTQMRVQHKQFYIWCNNFHVL